MKRKAGSYFCCLILFAACLCRAGAAPPDPKQKLQPLEFFAGSWHCAGRFTSSGQTIEADLSFRSVLEGAWLEFRHDDLPPHAYHALALWGWDDSAGKYVSVLLDSFGGRRGFSSDGWVQDRLIWLRDVSQDERFIFRKTGATEFTLGYERSKAGAWREVDSSVCKRNAGAEAH